MLTKKSEWMERKGQNCKKKGNEKLIEQGTEEERNTQMVEQGKGSVNKKNHKGRRGRIRMAAKT